MKKTIYGALVWVVIIITVVAFVSGCGDKAGVYRTNDRELDDYGNAVRNHENNVIHGEQFREQWND